MSDILSKVRKLNWLLQESPTGALSFNEMCEVLSDMLDANVYVCNTGGKVIGISLKIKQDSTIIRDAETGVEAIPSEYNEELMNVKETSANMSGDEALKIFKYDYDTSDKFHTVIPIVGGGNRWGTLVMARYEPEFSDEEVVLAETGATIVGLEIHRMETVKEEEEARLLNMVQMAVGTLSYSEVEAMQSIFNELDGSEGLLVASKIADRSGITRSVIVNALRKLESAGVIESRSMGMKGTRIKVLNPKLKLELSKIAI